jgi:[acyl-carrier-protein] S-malonyltransferase
MVAGHSLGELVALHAAGVFDVDTGLRLMQRRSALMAAAGGGAMTAVMGFERSELEELVAATDGVVIANDNSSAQVVLSGTPEAVAAVSGQLKCKRAMPLVVSGAFHSPFMAEAATSFAAELEAIPFADAAIPVLSNTDPTPERSGAALKQRLITQMTSGVRWRETMEQLEASGIDTAVEIGPGTVLSGLIKRSSPRSAATAIWGCERTHRRIAGAARQPPGGGGQAGAAPPAQTRRAAGAAEHPEAEPHLPGDQLSAGVSGLPTAVPRPHRRQCQRA